MRDAIDHANKAIDAVQADPDYVHVSAEHLEVRAIKKLERQASKDAKVRDWLAAEGGAERAVRLRLY